MNQVLAVGYGKVHFRNASASLSAFSVKPPFDRVLASKAHNSIGTSTKPVSDTNHVRGAVISNLLEVDDGTVLCVQMSQTFNGGSIRDGAIFLRARSTGPNMEIRSKLPIEAEGYNVGGEHVVFVGRADVLTLLDLNELGIVPTKNFIYGFMDEYEVEECFTVTTTAREKEPKPVIEMVESSSGKLVEIVVSRAPRRIRIRK